MPKTRPSEAKGGKRKRSNSSGSNRMAQLLAEAISKDKRVLREIKDMLDSDSESEEYKEDGERSASPCTIPGQIPNTNTDQHVTREAAKVRKMLLSSSLAASTRQSYDRFWARFTMFVTRSSAGHQCFPTSSDTVSLFVAYLYSSSFAPSTISSHLSAISYFHQIAGYEDPCTSFIIRRMVLGCRKLNNKKDCRLPLLGKHIIQLLNACDNLFSANRYNKLLYETIILITFHGFFRMGELLPSRLNCSSNVVQLHHVDFASSSVQVKLFHHKTQKACKPVNIVIPSQRKQCPVSHLSSYLAYRGKSKGPLFISSNQLPITISHFRGVFNELLAFAQLSKKQYKLHSFRIGACTQAIMSGTKEQEVMQMGRWKSHAFKRYIRLPHINMSASS